MTRSLGAAGVAALLAAAAAPAPASAGTIVYVCGDDLCRTDERGRVLQPLTRDGGYSRPTTSRDGRRIAFKRGDPGRAFTARLSKRGLRSVRRIGPDPGSPRDATQFDVAINPAGTRVAWVETRINVVSGGFDYRRYVANVDGSAPRQVASNGGRPFVGWFDAAQIIREGPADPQTGVVDASLCLPDPETETNGVCGRAIARDPRGRHLRHPSASPDGRLVAATAYPSTEERDLAIDGTGAIAVFSTLSGALTRDVAAAGASSPSFSPDGREIVYSRGNVLYRVSATGGRARRILRGTQPAWAR